jgi:hypothetical protein
VLVERTAGPSTPLRSGRDDNSFLTLTFPTINLHHLHCSINLPQANQLLLNETARRVGVRNNPTQAKRKEGLNGAPKILLRVEGP